MRPALAVRERCGPGHCERLRRTFFEIWTPPACEGAGHDCALARDWRCECTLLFAFYVADSPGVCVSDMPPPWRLFLRGGHRLRCLVSAAPVERSFAKPGAVRVLAELCSLALPPVDTLSAPLCAYLVLCALYFRFAHVNSTLRSRGPGPLGVELCSGPLGDGNGFL